MTTEILSRIFLVRHGEPASHQGKIFLGQTDVPLSEQGKTEAAEAAEKLLRLGVRTPRIYTSDLKRANETADIIGERLGGLPVVPDILFREMAMGSWDGELIEDIKAKFPEEYERRGTDLRNYRTPGGENFYDLQGRVTREFHRIFRIEAETEKNAGMSKMDLVIVAHLGVIVALTEEITQARDYDRFYDYPTGSVTVFETPKWLLT